MWEETLYRQAIREANLSSVHLTNKDFVGLPDLTGDFSLCIEQHAQSGGRPHHTP